MGPALVVLAVLVGIGLVVLVAGMAASSTTMSVALGLIAGGAVGNVVDRVRFGAVTDFLDLPRWPTFNVADCAIVSGVVLVFVLELAAARRERSVTPP